jgi:hypothetical protein
MACYNVHVSLIDLEFCLRYNVPIFLILVTSHRKVPSSTCEAVLSSPKFHREDQETFSAQHEASSQKVFKEHWLSRYKHSYPGKRDSREDHVDLLSVSQAEPPSFIARDIALPAEKSKVGKLKVPPKEKVQEWLERNGDEFDKETVQSFESNNVTVIADVHRGLEDEADLVSVSQQQFYIVPRKADVATLQSPLDSLCDNVKQASGEKRIFISRNGDKNDIKAREGQSAESDPYEFVSSQKIRTVPKRKVKGNLTVKKRESKDFKIYGPSLKKDSNESTGKKSKITCNSHPVSEFTFICPVDINDTFDNLVADSRKSEPAKSVKPVARKEVAGDDTSDDDDDDMCLFRTPLGASLTYQNNDGSTTESMSDIDFSSGSDEEWGVTNQVNKRLAQVNRRKTRGSSCDNLPSKVRATKSSCEQKTRPKSSGIFPKRNGKLETFGFGCKEISKHNLQNEDTLKKTPLSPVKTLNLTAYVEDLGINNMKQGPPAYKDTNSKSKDESVTCLSTDKAPSGKENIICLVGNNIGEEKINLDHSALKISAISRSPGWSRISQSKKDFERFKKPALKALNVSGGEVCIPKRHSASVSEMPKQPAITIEVVSPIPTIDDTDSFVGIPVVAFNSHEAMNRARMMSEIVMNLESQIGCDSSTENVAELSLPGAAKDVTLNKFVDFGSDGFNEPVPAQNSPKSCQRKKLLNLNALSLEDEDQQEHQCNGGNEWIMSGITKLDGDGLDAQDNDNMNNSVAFSKENISIVAEPNSTMAYEEDTENNEHNQGSHSRENCSAMKNLVVDMSKENISMVQDHNSIMDCEETIKNIEHNEDSHVRDHDNMKNPVTDVCMENVLMAQKSESSAVNEEALENIEPTRVMDQSITETREGCTGISTSAEPTDMSSKNLNNQTEILTETGQNASIDSKQLLIHQGKGECKLVNSSVAASRQPAQDFVWSQKCDKKKVPIMSADAVINFTEVPENSLFRTYSTKGMFTDVQPQVVSTEPMEMKAKHSHQTETESSHNSSVDLVNNCLNKIHIPFLKCGRLKSLRNFTKFVLLGSLAPRRKNVISKTFEVCSSVDLGMQFGATARSPLGMRCETGTQTSPGLLNPRHSSALTDVKIEVTPTVNPKFVQFITPTDTQGDFETVVPDSCDSTYSFPCAIPLSHHSAIQKTPVDSSKYTKTEDCLKTSGISEPIDVDKMLLVSDVIDDAGMNENVALRNHCGYSERDNKVDFEIPSSQLSTATTIKIQHVRTSVNENQALEKSPELSSNLVEHSSLSKSIIRESNNGKVVYSILDLCDMDTSEERVSDVQDSNPNIEERNAESQQQTEVIEFKQDNSTEQLIQDLNSKSSSCKPNDCSNTSDEKSSKRSSRVSRQLTFSPNFIPKLSDPYLDEKLHRTSYKRIREVATSSDFVSDGRESSDTLDLEQKEIKKPCHTSLRKASGEGMNNDMLPNDEYAETSPEVINLLTPPEEANVSSTPQADDKWLGEDMINSEELMARVMANIEADLIETRKRKMKEYNDSDRERGKESPTLFTPPSPVPLIADSEELDGKRTCELVVSEPQAESRRRPVKESVLVNITVGTDSQILCTQQRDKIQVGTAAVLILSFKK